MEGKVFISHSTADDVFVRELQQALGDLGQDVWIDSRQLRGGDPLWAEIQKAIEEASAFVVVVSPDALQSRWVGAELHYALTLRRTLGREGRTVVPLALNGTKLGVLETFFDEPPIYVPVSDGAGGVDAAMNAILVALGRRLPADVLAPAAPVTAPLEDLVLNLTDFRFEEKDGVRRASARAQLVYEPATAGQPEVVSPQRWRFVAPIGPIEAEELRWYLESFAVWPSEHFRGRARKVEGDLVAWGRLLYDAAIPTAHTSDVMRAWTRVGGRSDRRFSVHIDAVVDADTPPAEATAAREAATVLLGLPWELLHDGNGFLFQGATPTRVRRRLPNTRVLDVPVVATPIRILLVTARPEDDACGYIDHRASALPLVEAVESLGGLVHLHVLGPPTLPALREELDRARREGKPYHVVHFDGHGVYDPIVGLGGLCFEKSEDVGLLERRRHVTITTDELGPLLWAHRIPIVFLEACQTAKAEKASESVASELLRVGVASVVAMSHSVLVETALRFVRAFYGALARGERVGDAMLEGQRSLKDDSFRGRVFGAGELRLEDWFVPVLFQEKEDPQPFRTVPAARTQRDLALALLARLGELPPPPETGFVGRSRDLLALERLFRTERYAVVRGQGGEGKTTLAAEFARWAVRSRQIRRAAFVSVETSGNALAVLDAIGRQLVPGYSAATFDNANAAILPVEQALEEQTTLIVVDNMESVLLPPYVEISETLSEDARLELDAILKLCVRLGAVGETRLLFTSREALPAPFDAQRNRRELHHLAREDAVRLVERTLDAEGVRGAADAAREEIEGLVEAVNAHARTLALLAPSIRRDGVEATRASLVELMEKMDHKSPGEREKSLFASVELSLRRMSPENRERAKVLAVFHGVVDLDVLRMMMDWSQPEVLSLAVELVGAGLATVDPYNHLTLDPALCPYLVRLVDHAESETLRATWARSMSEYVSYLESQRAGDVTMGATLTELELPNLFALLDRVESAGNAAATVGLATSLYRLVESLGKPRLIERVAQARDAAAVRLDEVWNHARFTAGTTGVEQLLSKGRLREGVEGARALLQAAQEAGEDAYLDADFDLAIAHFLLGRAMKNSGNVESALPELNEAQASFEAVERRSPDRGAKRMASVCVTERGDCLRDLGRLDEAALAYEERIRHAEASHDDRGVAVVKGQLGTVRLRQRRYKDALDAHREARDRFTSLNEPGLVATAWHQIGRVYEDAQQPQEAEDAYRESLKIATRLGDVAGEASTLGQLGNLYDDVLGRPEDAVAFSRQAAEKHLAMHDAFREGMVRNNLADTLRRLGRLDEARREIHRAIECKSQSGYAAEPWKTWSVLANIERDDGRAAEADVARRKAIALYLDYRRAGGENPDATGHFARKVLEGLRTGDLDEVASDLEGLAMDPKNDHARHFVQALQAILAGSRDPALTDAPGLDYMMVTEVRLLLEALARSDG